MPNYHKNAWKTLFDIFSNENEQAEPTILFPHILNSLLNATSPEFTKSRICPFGESGFRATRIG